MSTVDDETKAAASLAILCALGAEDRAKDVRRSLRKIANILAEHADVYDTKDTLVSRWDRTLASRLRRNARALTGAIALIEKSMAAVREINGRGLHDPGRCEKNEA